MLLSKTFALNALGMLAILHQNAKNIGKYYTSALIFVIFLTECIFREAVKEFQNSKCISFRGT